MLISRSTSICRIPYNMQFIVFKAPLKSSANQASGLALLGHVLVVPCRTLRLVLNYSRLGLRRLHLLAL